LLMLIYKTSHPNYAVLGQLPGTEAYRDVKWHPEARTFPGLLIWRPGGDLFFANAGTFERSLKAAIAASDPPAQKVLIDAEAVSFIDSSTCEMLLSLVPRLQGEGIEVAFARTRDSVRARMKAVGVDDLVGSDAFYERVTGAVRQWQEREQSADSLG